MITLQVALFGALRQFSSEASIPLQCPPQATVGEVRQAILAYAQAHWPASALALIAVSAFASEQAVLREDQGIPENSQLALLPPVSGG